MSNFQLHDNTQFINPKIPNPNPTSQIPKIPKAGHPTQPPNTRPVTLTNATAAYHVTNRRRRIGFQDSLPQNYTEQAKPSRGWYQKTRLGQELKEKEKKKKSKKGGKERQTGERESQRKTETEAESPSSWNTFKKYSSSYEVTTNRSCLSGCA